MNSYQVFVFNIVNILIFIGLRYLSIFTIVFARIGPEAKYSIWDFVPAYALQLIVLLFFIVKNRKWQFASIVSIFILSILFLGRHYDLIPNSLIPS